MLTRYLPTQRRFQRLVWADVEGIAEFSDQDVIDYVDRDLDALYRAYVAECPPLDNNPYNFIPLPFDEFQAVHQRDELICEGVKEARTAKEIAALRASVAPSSVQLDPAVMREAVSIAASAAGRDDTVAMGRIAVQVAGDSTIRLSTFVYEFSVSVDVPCAVNEGGTLPSVTVSPRFLTPFLKILSATARQEMVAVAIHPKFFRKYGSIVALNALELSYGGMTAKLLGLETLPNTPEFIPLPALEGECQTLAVNAAALKNALAGMVAGLDKKDDPRIGFETDGEGFTLRAVGYGRLNEARISAEGQAVTTFGIAAETAAFLAASLPKGEGVSVSIAVTAKAIKFMWGNIALVCKAHFPVAERKAQAGSFYLDTSLSEIKRVLKALGKAETIDIVFTPSTVTVYRDTEGGSTGIALSTPTGCIPAFGAIRVPVAGFKATLPAKGKTIRIQFGLSGQAIVIGDPATNAKAVIAPPFSKPEESGTERIQRLSREWDLGAASARQQLAQIEEGSNHVSV